MKLVKQQRVIRLGLLYEEGPRSFYREIDGSRAFWFTRRVGNEPLAYLLRPASRRAMLGSAFYKGGAAGLLQFIAQKPDQIIDVIIDRRVDAMTFIGRMRHDGARVRILEDAETQSA